MKAISQESLGSDKHKEEKGARRLVITILIITASTLFALVIFNILTSTINKIVVSTIGILTLGAIVLAIKNILLPGQILIPSAILVSLIYFALEGPGLYDPSAIGYPALIILAALLLGERGAILFGILSALSILGLGLAEISGVLAIDATQLELPNDPLIMLVVFIGTAALTLLFNRRLTAKAEEAQRNELAQRQANKELLELKDTLELRIQERTESLESANVRSRRRADQLQVISEVSRAITLVQNLDELLPRLTSLISERFGYYHIGIFLLDETNEYAVLCASNSEGGKRMLKRGHRLQVGKVGIVGNVTYTGRARIALDTGLDAIHFDNPDLPDTRSEIALPLMVGERVIGALDVQSNEPNAFSDEDVETLSILADEVSIAIENSRLFDATQRSLTESETIYRQYIQQEWHRMQKEEEITGFRYDVTGATPLDAFEIPPEIQKAASKGEVYIKTSKKKGEPTQLAVPIMLHGTTLGILNINAPAEKPLNEDQIDLARAVAERLALALENARLFDEASRRAERERTVTDITSRIRSTTDPHTMLKTAVEELQRVLQADHVRILPQSMQRPLNDRPNSQEPPEDNPSE